MRNLQNPTSMSKNLEVYEEQAGILIIFFSKSNLLLKCSYIMERCHTNVPIKITYNFKMRKMPKLLCSTKIKYDKADGEKKISKSVLEV